MSIKDLVADRDRVVVRLARAHARPVSLSSAFSSDEAKAEAEAVTGIEMLDSLVATAIVMLRIENHKIAEQWVEGNLQAF